MNIKFLNIKILEHLDPRNNSAFSCSCFWQNSLVSIIYLHQWIRWSIRFNQSVGFGFVSTEHPHIGTQRTWNNIKTNWANSRKKNCKLNLHFFKCNSASRVFLFLNKNVRLSFYWLWWWTHLFPIHKNNI